MTVYEVVLTDYANEDLFDIYYHIATKNTFDKADEVINEVKKTCLSLRTLANRGHVPHEFELINLSSFLEIHHNEYRIIYEVAGNKVFIYAILHMKRDVPDLLNQRLLG